MVGPPYDCLANPLGAVRLTFEKAISSGSLDPASFGGKDWGAIDLFRNFLFDQANVSQVPLLNPTSIRWVQPHSLVRFRGMIQDMLGNEFYAGAYKDGSVWRTNKFADVSHFPNVSASNMQIWERRLLYCVPVPGLNSWTESHSEVGRNGSTDQTFLQREKRRRMDVEATDSMVSMVTYNEFQDSPNAKKMREDGNTSMSSQIQDEQAKGSCSTALPDIERDSLPCLVKVYDSPESELKLNDVFEFVGVLTFDSELMVEKDDYDELSTGLGDDDLVHGPPNKVPRLHCIIHRKLAMLDFLHGGPPTMEPKLDLVKMAREALLGHLTTVLGNDGLAAHFMLLHLLSRVHARVDNVAVGKLSLNLTALNKESVTVFGTQLRISLESLLPFTHWIPLTVQYLNTASLAPRKDYDINRLVPGVLQLAEGSQLIIDETKLEAGTLNPVGVENVRLLKELTELQKVDYDFKYYKMEMAADVHLLVLSEGKSNILPADIVIPFQPSVVSNAVVAAEALEAWRWYLSTVRSLPHSIDLEMQKVVENDLVAARQADRSLGSQDFSRWLTMGRLMSASFGETCLTLEHWQMVRELERLRSERLK
ncbi:mini-chromosome maintenance complex-binding protein [Tripterygium wilfordii]|uniref:mini-chromosome maintenance complex-binding protein n=1 Tax=Tripterygium wilfordii TaxID=458696 RepID=UPI0018F84D97|nr:mini-chromosome maintenance complex-binding protein [Tripterygium wilfordii]